MIRVGIVGATGYTGSELIRLLSGHPQVQITALVSRSEAGKPVAPVLAHLYGLELPTLSEYDPDALAKQCAVVFLAGETGFAMEHAPTLLQRGVKLIDLSADFRLKDPAVFAEWYGKTHSAPDLLREAVYGLPELIPAEAYGDARLIANPGCYPTAAGLALAPLVKTELADPESIIIDAKSGVSGAGRSRVTVDYLFTELDENFKAYGVERHRHTPEIEQTLSAVSGQTVRVRFTPHLVPMTRGILCTAYARLRETVSPERLHALYAEFYQGQPFVVVRPLGNYPATREVYGSNRCDIGLTVDARTNTAVIISAIDNLVKGAAGQAIQNMNLLLGLPPTMGLPLAGIAP
ncbi:MAG: N-acetyl-gamma-glutamyl-phosphate reductase [Armatimonadetes bacterium CP1_7O]|nr:MAG: N-acetyl-gamma-glutamyl-phosphate reductase [Armatimonadetes bacterium CP1_7O]